MNKSCEKKPTAHSQNMLHVDVLYNILLAEKQQIPILHSFVWPDLGSYPQSITLEASTLTIMLPMRFPIFILFLFIDWLARNQNNVSKWNDISTRWLLLAHLAKANVSFYHHLVPVVCHLFTFHILRGEHANHYATDAVPYFYFIFIYFFYCPSIYYLKTKINPKQLRVTWYLSRVCSTYKLIKRKKTKILS
jgi:hypothetical protein